MQRKALIICFCLIWGLLLLADGVAAERGIKVTSRLDGQTLRKEYSTGNNLALIIGINEYQHHPNLKTAVNDAKAIIKVLRDKYFFSKNGIVFLKDREATKANILKAFRDIVAQSVKEGDNVFIYYAGHGWFDDILETGYWVTSEASKDSATFLENNIIYKYIVALDRKGVQHVFIVSDSCFAGSFTKEHRAIETEIDDRYFKEKYKKPSRNMLASGGVEPVADKGKGGHSIFAYYFLKTLQDNTSPFLSAKQVGVAVEQLVSRNSDQTPLSRFIHGAGDEGGQFFFINSKSYSTGNVMEPVPYNSVVLPKEDEASFDDILMIEREQRQAKEKWKDWQGAKDTQYRKVKDIDESENLTPKQKSVAWKRFLAAVAQDNPYSQQDDEMRSFSRSRLLRLENEQKRLEAEKTKIEMAKLPPNNNAAKTVGSETLIQSIDISDAPFKGPTDAPVVIAVFSGFQCPYCARLVPLLEQVLERNPYKVKVVFKNFPLKYHKFSTKAATAALAADDQGKFWEFHDLLFKDYKRLNDEKVKEIARKLSLDEEEFEKKRNDPILLEKIRQDLIDGRKVGVRGIPTIFVNGRLLKNRSLAGFQAIIDSELGKL